jgi:hypothetical protein
LEQRLAGGCGRVDALPAWDQITHPQGRKKKGVPTSPAAKTEGPAAS